MVFSDVASGLSDRRAGLRKALSECMKPGVDRLLVEHPDRLARFGVGLIEHLLAGYGVEVVYTGQADDESPESELVRDMLAIVTSFAGRLYGQRSARTKRLRAAVSAETECGDPRENRERREWRGVKPVAAPSGVAITTRLRTSADEDRVLDLVAGHLGALRRADLAAVSQPEPVDPGLDAEGRAQVRRGRLNARKKQLTGQSSARWANAIIAGNDDQFRLAREAQYRHIVGLRAAIATIEARWPRPPATC